MSLLKAGTGGESLKAVQSKTFKNHPFSRGVQTIS